MARKPATRAEFTLFDVVYEDGSQRSNRRVPSEILGGLDGDAPILFFNDRARGGVAVQATEDSARHSAVGALRTVLVDHVE